MPCGSGAGPRSFQERAATSTLVTLVLDMRARKLLHRTLVSHDAGWYHVGETNGGEVRPYTLLFERVLPALRKAGFTAAEKKQLIVDNPRTALVPRRNSLACAEFSKICRISRPVDD